MFRIVRPYLCGKCYNNFVVHFIGKYDIIILIKKIRELG